MRNNKWLVVCWKCKIIKPIISFSVAADIGTTHFLNVHNNRGFKPEVISIEFLLKHNSLLSEVLKK